MALVRTVLIILALMLGWTAVRQRAQAHVVPVTANVQGGPSMVHWLVWHGGRDCRGLAPLLGSRRHCRTRA